MNYFPATADNASIATAENNQIMTTGKNSIAAKTFWNIKTKWPGTTRLVVVVAIHLHGPLRIVFRYGASQASQAAPTFLFLQNLTSKLATNY